MSKLRVWWIPQIGIDNTFYVPVESPEDGKKLLDTLAAYDMFQFTNNIKPDYCNVGGLQQYNEESGEWEDWYLETETDYYDDLDYYCEECERAEELKAFSKEVLGQIDYSKMPD